MAQLKDDCFAFGGGLMPLADALARLDDRIACIAEPESVPLDAALDRFAAADVAAAVAVPPHDNSAVDGYAVYFDDLAPDAETRLPVAGRVAAGHPLDGPAPRGAAIRVFTGAPMPIGADGTQAGGPDTVFMEEDATPDGDVVVLPAGLKRGSNRRFAGEDVQVGRRVIARGCRLRPQDIGLAASVGCASLSVYRPLRACVFSTGDEIRDPGDGAAERPGAVFDANRYTVKAMLRRLGLAVTDLGILPDDEAAVAEALSQAARTADLVITSGGVSAGEEDHVKAAVDRGGRIDVWRLAIKPGRPVALGHLDTGGDGRSCVFVGLPGNPVAAMVTFLTIARPVILTLQGAAPEARRVRRYRVEAGFDTRKKAGRREWLRARLEVEADGRTVARKFASSGAGILTSMTESDGLIELPEDATQVAPGDMIDYLPFNEVM
jgi:molybdopterin molybdotransferase